MIMLDIDYLVKSSLTLTLLFALYQLLLRHLTFYRWNRAYLLASLLITIILPVADISPWVGGRPAVMPTVLYPFPTSGPSAPATTTAPVNWLPVALVTGLAVLGLWRLVQLRSLWVMRRNATKWYRQGPATVYKTTSSTGAFTTGRSIYVNPGRYTSEELQRIIQHEMVHVKQYHTVDLVLTELFCLLNWYNPFAWLIRRAVRRNLEFIADGEVLLSGHDKKSYQYLLLKAMGVPQYTIANHFNLRDIKKRIHMMNTSRSHPFRLVSFFLLLPLLGCLLFAFRGQAKPLSLLSALPTVRIYTMPDTVPDDVPNNDTRQVQKKSGPNAKGYQIDYAYSGHGVLVIVNNSQGKFVEAMPVENWDKNKKSMEQKYGRRPDNPKELGIIAQRNDKFELTLLPDSNGQVMRATATTLTLQPDKTPDEIQRIVIAMKKAGADNHKVDSNGTAHINPYPPIYIVDDVEQAPSFDINSIPSSSIESVHVFKGASALEEFGERGKNGVILIQLKKTPAPPPPSK